MNKFSNIIGIMSSFITIYTFVAGFNTQSFLNFFKEDHTFFWLSMTAIFWLVFFSLKAIIRLKKQYDHATELKFKDLEDKINRRIINLSDVCDERLAKLEQKS